MNKILRFPRRRTHKGVKFETILTRPFEIFHLRGEKGDILRTYNDGHTEIIRGKGK